MLKAERHNKMIEYINKFEKVSVDDLAEIFDVSRPTVVRDLSELSKRGRIYRTRGFAISVSNRLSMEMPYKEKEVMNVSEKKKIASLALPLIGDNKSIIIDSGSTNLELAKMMTNKKAIVITNDIRVALEFSTYDFVDLYVSPGKLVKQVYTLDGSLTVSFFKDLSVDILFLGIDAIDFETGIYNSEIDETLLKKVMIESASYVVALVDSSKFGNRTFVRVGDIELIDCLVTDSITKEQLNILKEKNIRVITPKIDTFSGR